MRNSLLIGLLVFASSTFLSGSLTAAVEFDTNIPQLAFAAQELDAALKETGKTNLKISLKITPDATSPEAFSIKISGAQIDVIGTDATGAMYGGLEVADRLRLGLAVEDQKCAPFVSKRGIKFNIPFDARTPSYDDTGDAAQKNIETVWDFEFWKAYLDDLARYRYNVLSLWSTHPYPSIVKLEAYPDVALDDVYRVADGVMQPQFKNRLQDVDFDAPGVLELVKKIPMDEKIAHWQRVFQYAEDRGIEIYIFHWNVMTFGATGKHGITPDQTNPVTVDYMRASVRQALLTYPQISGIGVTAGENADNHLEGEFSIENFLFNTYGKAVLDVRKQQPEREVRFIFRQHMSGLGPITEAFADYPGEFNTSFKYAIGHMYSWRKPLLFDRQFRKQVEEYEVPCWLNLRNDDMFVLRWGSPDYVRDYIQQMPHDVLAGFYMGSDGYVWGREFVAKNPELAGRLEIDKHWYRFRLWGQLAYNPALDRDYWEAALKHRFPGVDAKLLHDAWAATSEIIPLINSANFWPNDAHFAPEGCIAREGFLTVDAYFFKNEFSHLMEGTGFRSVEEWGQAVAAGNELEGMTPIQVADSLDRYAETALAVILSLRKQAGNNVELLETLNDIESMAYLGRYYADKTRGAAKLAAFRESQQKQFSDEAVGHLRDAVQEWKAYAAIVSSQYKPQLLARTHFMDWNGILPEVEKEVAVVEREGDFPDIRFTNLKNGERFPERTDLRVELAATDRDGIREMKLYLNGLLLKAHAAAPHIWSGESDELLRSLKAGTYRLKAVAEDNTGTFGRREIQIAVGDATKNELAPRSDEIYQVILENGEKLMDSEVRDFPRLECNLEINEDGRLVLHGVIPGKSRDRQLLWKAPMYKSHGSHFATLENGQLVIYRGTSEHPEATPFKSREVFGPGPYKLGITVSKKLVIFREIAGRNREVVWTSN